MLILDNLGLRKDVQQPAPFSQTLERRHGKTEETNDYIKGKKG